MSEFENNNNTFSGQPENTYMNQQINPDAVQQTVNQQQINPDTVQQSVNQQANVYMGQQPQYTSNPAMGNFSPEQAIARANDYSPQTGFEPQGSYPGQDIQSQGGYINQTYQNQASYDNQTYQNQTSYDNQSYQNQASYDNQTYQNQTSYDNQSYQKQTSYDSQSYQNQVSTDNGQYQNMNSYGNMTYQGQSFNQQGFQQQLSYQDANSYSGAASSSPLNPIPEESGKKHTVQILIIVAAFLLISLGVVSVFMNWGPFKQSGGRETVSDLMNDYVSALNNQDVDAYLKLLPKGERTDKERSEVQKAMSKLAYTGGDMTITVGASKSYSDSKKTLVKDKLNKLSALPVRVDSVQEVNATITGEGYEQHIIFTVVESNGKFFIDDLTEK